jgi:CHAD domain-containing protein
MGLSAPSHESLLGVVARILAERSAAMERHWSGAIEGTDPEQLHDLRVNARRVLAALRIFRDVLPRKSRKHADRLKALIRLMGGTRELDVFLASLKEQRTGALGDLRALDLLAARVAQERDERHRTLVRALRTSAWRADFRRFLEELS